MPLTDETRLAAREIVARYPRSRSALLPMLHLVQSEDGYVSPEGVRFCADELGLTKAEVGAVATFYTMYKRRPTGDYLVSVCTNTLCDVLGGEQIYEALSEHLGVGHDQTTADGKITLEHAECLAACDYAPVVTVNYEFFDQQSPESAMDIVEGLQGGRLPLPTRGAPLCTFKEISRQLAGFIDERPGALDAGPAGEPTLIGNRLAVRNGETAPAYDAPAPLDTKPAEPPAAPAGAQAPPAPAAPAEGERPAAATTAAEQSAASGTARYGGPPEEASSGGGEGGEGLQTAQSDPHADASPDKEPEAAKATSASTETSATGGSSLGADRGPATNAGTSGTADAGSGSPTEPGRPGATGPTGGQSTGPADGAGAAGGQAMASDGAGGSDEAGGPATDRPAPTNRGRKTRRKEG